MANKAKLREILAILSPDGTETDFKAFDEGVDKLKSGLKQKIQAKTLEDVNGQLDRFKKGLDFEPLFTAIKDIDKNFDERIRQVASALAEEVSRFDELSKSEREETGSKVAESSGLVDSLRNELETLKTQKEKETNDVIEALKAIPELRASNENTFNEIKARLDALEVPEAEEPDLISPIKQRVEEVRTELISKIASTNHGDHANRNLAFNGNPSVLTRYTDTNFIAGSNVQITYTPNNVTKYTDVTIAATGGSGSVIANAAGQNTQIQYNDNGVFGASSTFTWNKNTSIFAVGNSTNPSVLSVNGPSSLVSLAGNMSANNIAIGTTTFTRVLTVLDNTNPPARFQRNDTSTSTSVATSWLELYNPNTTSSNLSQITFVSNDSAASARGAAGIKGVFVARSSGTITGELSFGVNPSTAGTLVEAMRINSLGNVGIGAQNPLSRLQVGTAGSISGTVRLAGPTGGTTVIQTASIAGDWVMTLPSTAGVAGQYLLTDGAGITQWASVTASGGTGITRNVSIITANTTAGNTANTDYVFFANAGMNVTLPTAVGNSNQYIVKNMAATSVLVSAAVGQDIDGSTTVLLDRQYTALSFISNNSVWGVLP